MTSKIAMMTLSLTSAVSVTLDGHMTSQCPEILNIKGFEPFELQLNGNYKNGDDSIIIQNPEDSTWFIMGESHGTIVSFDKSKCPADNKNWHILEQEEMKYSPYEINFL